MRTSFVCLTSVILSVCGLAKADLNDGLVAYYPFNGDANDESGNGNDGEILDGGVFTVDRHGVSDTALSLVNNDYRVRLDALADLSPTTSQGISVSFWATKDLQNVPVLGQYPDNVFPQTYNNNFYVAINGNGWNISGRGTDSFSGSADLSSALWQHWFVQIFPGNDGIKVYLNGALEGTASVTFNPTAAAFPLYIGQILERAYPSPGSLDDIRIYNRALTAEEVSSLYALESQNIQFQVIEGPFTWQEARADAEAKGGRLAVLNTQAKIDAANAYLEGVGENPNLWIGLTTSVGVWGRHGHQKKCCWYGAKHYQK